MRNGCIYAHEMRIHDKLLFLKVQVNKIMCIGNIKNLYLGSLIFIELRKELHDTLPLLQQSEI